MLDLILLGLAAACALYFVVIVLYAGIGTSFAFIWLFFAALLIFLVYGKWYCRRSGSRIAPWIPVSVVTTCVAGVAVLAILCGLVFLGAASPARPGLDYVIVLGARGKEHGRSDTLKCRLERALSYAQENPETFLVLSGGREAGEEKSEAEVMRDYLVYNGVEPGQLLLEERSISTVENIAYSKVVIEAHRERLRQLRRRRLRVPESGVRYLIAPDKPLEIGILTSNFHIFRARQTALHWGLENTCAISAPSDPVLFIHLCVRECASIIKDRLMGNM